MFPLNPSLLLSLQRLCKKKLISLLCPKKKTVKSIMLIIQTLLHSLIFSTISVSAISLGSTLLASNRNQSWLSPNNTFSLHFVPVQPQTSSPSFIAAIVFSGGAPIIWSAGNGAFVDEFGSLQFLSTGSLRLANSSGAIVWDSATSNIGVSSAFLGDNGNLVLYNSNGAAVWSSFEHPTDTIVPSQNFTTDMVLKSGLYSFKILMLGNLALSWNGSVSYWNRGFNSSINGTLTWPVLRMQPTGVLSILDPNLTSSAIVSYSSDYAEGSDVLRILRLDNDGNLRIYGSNRGSRIQTIRWAAIEDQCEVFGYCGNYGICSYSNSKPICRCPSQNFDMIDPNDSRKGCRRVVKLESCPGKLAMLPLDHTQIFTHPPIFLTNPEVLYIPISACTGNCLSSSSCFASTSLSDGTGFCYQKYVDLISGYQNPKLPSTSYVKVCSPVVPNPQTRKGNDWGIHAWIIMVLVLGTILVIIAFEGGLWLWCRRNGMTLRRLSGHYAILEYASGALVEFSYKELHRSTMGFREKLGAGPFGAVYRGVLANTTVAVKKLEGVEQGEKQLTMEVANISSAHHVNLVKLIGFCSEGRHRLLVYEFMRKGSLDNFLFENNTGPSGKLLNWECRFNIALGSARGIMYLHEECRNCFLHYDLKPENILLDENYNAKVSDYGIARLVSPTVSRYHALASMRGFRGYLAPEWFANLPITYKSDVYSYGMVLLEILSGRRNFEASEETKRKKFSIWAYEEFEKDNIQGILDRRLADHGVNLEQVERMILTSFWCIQEQPSQRPTMGKVVQMLEGIRKIDKPPAPIAMARGFSNGTGVYYLSSNTSAVSAGEFSSPACLPSSSPDYRGISPLL